MYSWQGNAFRNDFPGTWNFSWSQGFLINTGGYLIMNTHYLNCLCWWKEPLLEKGHKEVFYVIVILKRERKRWYSTQSVHGGFWRFDRTCDWFGTDKSWMSNSSNFERFFSKDNKTSSSCYVQISRRFQIFRIHFQFSNMRRCSCQIMAVLE